MIARPVNDRAALMKAPFVISTPSASWLRTCPGAFAMPTLTLALKGGLGAERGWAHRTRMGGQSRELLQACLARMSVWVGIHSSVSFT